MSRIDYDLTKIRGIVFDVDGVLSPSTIPMNDDGVPQRMANIKDGYALQLAVKQGYQIAIITGGDTESIRKRYEVLGIEDIFLKASMKLPVLNQWMEERGLVADQVAFVGDDIPDYEAMMVVGLPICPADAAPEIKGVSVYVSPVEGGYGVARDVLEQVMRVNGHWLSSAKAFGW
ncbi:MAG: HAD hydrolase-like protein [Bacteroidales bacterium]|nr:HAD hydrolase-like protein [Bacteroidales bacterium]